MLYRKIESRIKEFITSGQDKMLIVEGARQVGKSFIIRKIGHEMFPNYIEVNMEEDKMKDKLFAQVRTTADFYLALSTIAGDKMKSKTDTLVFIDEIQAYPQLLTLAKFLVQEARYTYIASGSLLGVTLEMTQSIPIGSIQLMQMYPLDFEEFLVANGVGREAIEEMRKRFEKKEQLAEALHDKVMDLFRKYLLVGGMPDCVNIFIKENNIMLIRKAQQDIHALYLRDAAKYEHDNGKKLKIRRIYEMIPSTLENKKKRIVAKDVENVKGKRMSSYQDEFDYLISAGIVLEVKAISQPSFPLVQNSGKNLLKLYMNDVGIFTGLLYQNNIKAVMEDMASINLGSVYENVVAQELKAHGFSLYYYDNKKNGEVDFLTDDYVRLSVLPIEVKSGKDYTVHSALNHFITVKNYNISSGIVFSNSANVRTEKGITYLPIYDVMFLDMDAIA